MNFNKLKMVYKGFSESGGDYVLLSVGVLLGVSLVVSVVGIGNGIKSLAVIWSIVFIVGVALLIKRFANEIDKDGYKKIKQTIEDNSLTLDDYQEVLKSGRLTYLNYCYLLGIVKTRNETLQVNNERSEIDAVKAEILDINDKCEEINK